MAEADVPKPVNYSSNSKKKTPAQSEAPERPLPAQIVAGTVAPARKSLGRKMREQFGGDDAQTVGQYLLFDVVIPATKNLIFDLGREGLQRILFGGTRPSGGFTGSALSSGLHTNYKAYSSSPATTPKTSVTPMTPEQRAMHDFSGAILQTREQGLDILDVLNNLISDYGACTVNDFYACIGQSSDFTQVKYGWKTLAQAQVRHVREGYLLEMPRPIVLE